MKQLNKMDDNEELVPHSTRLVNFEFQVTKKIDTSPDFIAIKADTNVLVNIFILALKEKNELNLYRIFTAKRRTIQNSGDIFKP